MYDFHKVMNVDAGGLKVCMEGDFVSPKNVYSRAREMRLSFPILTLYEARSIFWSTLRERFLLQLVDQASSFFLH